MSAVQNFMNLSALGVFTNVMLSPSETIFIEYGNLLRSVIGEEEQMIDDYRNTLKGGILFAFNDLQEFTFLPGHQRDSMDDDTSEQWGDWGPAVTCSFVHQPAPTHGSDLFPPLEVWAMVDQQLLCVEKLEWVEDCLRFIGKKASLGYFGDMTLSRKTAAELTGGV
jgi:hypothetical protein